MTHPHISLIASVPRSGGTWAFNAVRAVLEAGGRVVHAAWIADYSPDHSAPWHVIKAHRAEQVSMTPDFVITTQRDLAERLASLMRLGWLEDNPDAILAAAQQHSQLSQYWGQRSNLNIPYTNIVTQQRTAITAIAQHYELSLDEKTLARIEAHLSALTAPAAGQYNSHTLLHPNHRNQSRTEEDAPRIREIIGDLE